MKGAKRTGEAMMPDPITTEVVGSTLLAAAEEMGENLVRASFSTNVKERNGTGFSEDPSDADGSAWLGFRLTLVGNQTTLLAPTFDTVAIPYQIE